MSAFEKRIGLVAGALSAAVIAAVAVSLAAHDYQWDLRSYYYAVRLCAAGQNPYSMAALRRMPEEIHNPFVYPLAALAIFRPLARLEYRTAYLVFLGLKLLGLAGLLLLWHRGVFERRPSLPLLLFLAAFGYGAAGLIDLQVGNVATFEALLIWAGLLLWSRGKSEASAIAFALAAICKLTPILFLSLPAADRRGRLWAAGALALFAGVVLLPFRGHPEWLHTFLTNGTHLDERGAFNPSSLALFRDLSDALGVPHLAPALYAAFAAGVLSLAWRRGRGRSRLQTAFLCVFAYALVMPRFKNYSYLLLIPPTADVIANRLSSNALRLLALAAVCAGYWGYTSFFAALAIFAALLAYPDRGAGAVPAGGEMGTGRK